MSALDSIAALALHPGTSEPEWQAAAIAFFRVHRSKGTSPVTSEPQGMPACHFARRRPAWANRATASPFLHKIIPNEKFPGMTVGQVIRLDPDYATEMISGWAARRRAKVKAKNPPKPRKQKVPKGSK
jgi:hypothetical protein